MVFGKHINRYYLRYSGVLLLGLLALIAVDYVQLVIPELYKSVINGINDGVVLQNGQYVPFDLNFLLDEVCLPLLIIILILVVGRFLWRICFFGTAIRVENNLRNRMFDHCKDLSHQYYQVNKVGNMMSLFTNDLETVQECFGYGIMVFFDAAFLGGLAVFKMSQMNGFLTVLSMIPMLFLLLSGIILSKHLMKKWDERQEAFSELSDFSQENFSGISVIKAFVKESLELAAFRRLNRKNEKINVEYTKLSTLMRISLTLFVESVICVILGYGGYLVWNGTFNAGELIEFISYFNTVIWPVMAISELIEMSSRGKASLKRISELLDAEIDVCDKNITEELTDVKGRVEFRHLTFRYPNAEHDALTDISCTIEAGENVGLVGKTGSGKTTLTDLLLRTFNVPDGTVFIDGHDVNRVPIRSVRAACAYVPQDNFLFSDTIANNIGFSADDVDERQVEAAARMSDVHQNIVDFTEGYQTVLGERGVTVSGGQKQRISIARALLKEAPIMLLDDSVSAVDTNTERVILENLKTARKGKTTVLIAHRISTVEQMDKIIFIDNGKLMDIGKHSELYARCPEYRRMVDLQKLEEEEGGNR